jgi:hypothetical protein
MTASNDVAASKPKRRPAAQQLNRTPGVMHASWLAGLGVLLAGGVTVGGFSLPGLLFLIVLFLPIIIAYRRDRLSFPIMFATLFLPAWPWAMIKACSRHKAAQVGPGTPVTDL